MHLDLFSLGLTLFWAQNLVCEKETKPNKGLKDKIRVKFSSAKRLISKKNSPPFKKKLLFDLLDHQTDALSIILSPKSCIGDKNHASF